MATKNSFGALASLRANDRDYKIYRLDALEKAGVAKLSRVPFSIKVLLENLLRFEDERRLNRATLSMLRNGRGRLLRKFNSVPPAFCCKTLPEYHVWSIWPLCGTR